MDIVKMEHVTKIYGSGDTRVWALDDVNLTVQKGESLAVVGASGSGKSTLLHVMGGVDTVTNGKVIVDDRDITTLKDEEMSVFRRRKIGFVFQNFNLLPRQSALDNVALPLQYAKVPIKKRKQKAKEMLEMVDLADRVSFKPTQLSGGQKQRVAIAGVVAMEPKCIVMDEPTAMLDPVGRKEVLKTVHKLRKQKNVTVILITHYMEEVVDADKIFVMDHGKVVMEGTPKEIFSRVDELKSYRLDVPQVTILADELRKRGLDIPKGILRKEELVEAITHLQQ